MTWSPAFLIGQTGVAVALNSNGLSSLTYNGVQFLSYGDLRLDQVTFQNPDQSTTPGSTSSTVAVDAVRQIQTRTYSWGTIAVNYTVGVNRLNMAVTVTNSSPLPIQQIWFEALGLAFPSAIQNYDGVDPIITNTLGQPALVNMNFATGVVVVSADDVTKPLQIGFPYAFDRPGNTTFPLTLNTGMVSSYPNSFPFINRPIPAGSSDQFQFSLRFGPPGSTTETLAPDTYQAFAAAFPSTLNWPDRRPIGQIVIATSAAGYPKNPRGWFLNPLEDVTTPAGVAQFQQDLLNYAANSISILKSMNAQGAITWDIEGEQYPQPTSYIGDPTQFATLAPEMAGIADQYFAMFRSAGLRVGVTIRPQNLVVPSGGSAPQQVPIADPTQLLIAKASYAHSRWGATLFYIDSNVNAADPNPIDPKIIKTLAAAFPDSLFIPEHSETQYFAYSAPYRQINQGYITTPPDARFTYPNSFTVLYTADAPLTQDFNQLVSASAQGDVFLFRGWYADPQNQQISGIYNAAHSAGTVNLSVAPQSSTLSANQTQQFSASVSGSTNQNVSWAASLGTVTASGLYTAPASVLTPQSATVTATSQADATKTATAFVTINPAAPPVTITVAPQIGTLTAGQSLQFMSTVSGSSNQQVAWSTNLGSISPSGLYTSPAAIPTAQAAVVTAISAADPTKSASASVTINPAAPVSISINPQTGTLTAGQSLQFTTSVTGSANQQAVWSTTLGSVSASGLYTSPAGLTTVQTAVVTAVSAADSTKSASAAITINPATPVSISLNPLTATLLPSQSVQFTSSVSGTANLQVTWKTTLGSISATGIYIAPANISTSQNAIVTVTSAADPTKSASANITINPVIPVSISVSPQTGTLAAGQTILLTASVTGSPNQQVTWNATSGSITPSGLYFAPAGLTALQTAVVTATSAADPTKSASAVISLVPAFQPLTCPAPSTNAFTGCYYQDRFFGTLGFTRVDPQINFNWLATPPGSGVGPDNFTVRWMGNFTFQTSNYTFTLTSDDGSRLFIDGRLVIDYWGEHPAIPYTTTVPITSGSHLIQLDYEQLTGAASTVLSWTTPTGVTLNPLTAVLSPGQTAQFTSIVTGLSSQQVTWTATPPGIGTISSSGLYTAPLSATAPQAVTITATSVADPTKSASASVTISPAIAVSVTPPLASLNPSQSLQFNAVVTGSSSQQVTWSLTPPGVGILSSAGLYTAPVAIAALQTVTMTATSVADPTKSATAAVTLNPAVIVTPAITVSLTPPVSSLAANQTVQFAATVNGSLNQAVTWSVVPLGVGTVSPSGLYTSPAAVSSPQTVTVTATSVADPTKSASSSVALSPVASALICGIPSSNAFTGCYYQDRSFSVLGFTRLDPQINFNWTSTPPGQGVGPENYSVRWLGTFMFAGGNYAFTLSTDDGSRLWVDGQLTIDYYSEHPAIPFTKTVFLSSGPHLIQVDYFQLTGAASASLTWTAQ